MLHEDTWYSTYQSEPKVVLIGTKPKPEPVEPDKPAKPGKTTTGDAAAAASPEPATPALAPAATR